MTRNLKLKQSGNGTLSKINFFHQSCLFFLSLVALVFFMEPGLYSQSADSSFPAASPSFVPDVSNEIPDPNNITLDFKEADINTVLRVLSLKSKVNIVAGPEVEGTITIRLENVPWEKALQVVLRTYGYDYERDGNIIRVTTR